MCRVVIFFPDRSISDVNERARDRGGEGLVGMEPLRNLIISFIKPHRKE